MSTAVALILLGGTLFVLLAYLRQWQWTGIPGRPSTGDSQARPSKTLWDWLQLLGIPLALTAFAFLIGDAQERRDERHALDDERETTLRTYLAQMSDLVRHDGLLRLRHDGLLRPSQQRMCARSHASQR